MLYDCIRAEKMKWKRAPFRLLFFLIPIFPAIIGTINYSQNIGILTEGWYSLWTQHTLFYSNFSLPPHRHLLLLSLAAGASESQLEQLYDHARSH